jgi:hypothetical protein
MRVEKSTNCGLCLLYEVEIETSSSWNDALVGFFRKISRHMQDVVKAGRAVSVDHSPGLEDALYRTDSDV